MRRPEDNVCCLNGRIQRVSEARLHPLDRGFLFGDSIYEVVKVLGGAPVFLAPHLARLQRSLAAVSIPMPPHLERTTLELLGESGLYQGSLYYQITRGVAPRSTMPQAGLEPTVFVLADAHPHPVLPGAGLTVRTAADWRWRRCDVKTTSLMGTVLGKLEAQASGDHEVVFVDDDGGIREGGSTNVLVRVDGRWTTSPLGRHILPGVTRAVLADLLYREGEPLREEVPRLAQRARWEEVVLCGTLTGVQGVVRWDGEPVGDGSIGPATRALAESYTAIERLAAESWRREPGSGRATPG